MVEAALDELTHEGGKLSVELLNVENPLDNARPRNTGDLENDLKWLAEIIDVRFKDYFQKEPGRPEISLTPPPDLSQSSSSYARFIGEYRLNIPERVAVILALTPYLRPKLLDVFFTKNINFDRPYTEFGGYLQNAKDFIPTIETLSFIIAGDKLDERLAVLGLFEDEHLFIKENIFSITPPHAEDSLLKAPLRVSHDYHSLLVQGRKTQPKFNQNFPAERIQTELSWDDLVLHPGTARQIKEISTWVEHGETLVRDWGMGSKIRPGYRALFYGPPGTGKTMTACLLAKSTGRDVYRIDLSMVVSKYIGETEKNLAKVFNLAQHKDWILFFDEADALFGKRTETQSSNDRFANQEVAFLLQRIETFDGVAILSSNLKDNLDDAFARRFESMVFFPMPKKEERLKLWRQAFSKKAVLDPAIDLEQLAKNIELAGGGIINVVRYASMLAISRGENRITLQDLEQGISREYRKEGKS